MGDATDAELRAAVLDLLDQRAEDATICPSEVARSVHDGDDEGWRDLMDPVRRAAAGLAEDGEVVVTQRGTPVDLATVRGPVRLGRPSA